MPLGELIRDLRVSRGWSQDDLARRLCAAAGRDTLGREDVSRWERSKIVCGRFWQGHLAHVLGVSADVLAAEATLDRMNRRDFLSLATLTAAHGAVAADLAATVAAGDSGPLATTQTSHGTDLVLASLLEPGSVPRLRRWIGEADPVLRVNACGILAKLPTLDTARDVATLLSGDADVRALYATAVLARSCAVDWATATRWTDPTAIPAARVGFVAARLAREAVNPRDVGARWVAADTLRSLSPRLTGAPCTSSGTASS